MSEKKSIKRKILFIGHEASRTGAPKILHSLISNLILNNNVECYLLLQRGGTFLKEYEDLKIPLFVLSQNGDELEEIMNKIKPDVVYGNTIVTAKLTAMISDKLKIPSVLHVHELLDSIDAMIGRDVLKDHCDHINIVLAAGHEVESVLKDFVKIEQKKIICIEEFGPFKKISELKFSSSKLNKLVPEIPKDGYVVMGCGTGMERKGVDLFVDVAKRTSSMDPNIYFLWVGLSGEESIEINTLVHSLDLSSKVFLVGQQENILPYFRRAKMFLLTSREDPFPLVCLEASCFLRPIICFDGGNGIRAFAEWEGALTAKYLDAEDMAEKVLALKNDPLKARRLARNAKRYVLSNNDEGMIVPRIEKMVLEIQ